MKYDIWWLLKPKMQLINPVYSYKWDVNEVQVLCILRQGIQNTQSLFKVYFKCVVAVVGNFACCIYTRLFFKPLDRMIKGDILFLVCASVIKL